MKERKRLGIVLEESEVNIFMTMYNNNVELPWFTGDRTKDLGIAFTTDTDYSIGHSHDKFISPLVNKLLDASGHLTQQSMTRLCNIITMRYLDKWTRLWDSLHLEYNPLNNYDMAEEMENDETIKQYGKTTTRTPSLTHTKTGTEADTPNVTETETPRVTKTNKVRGFNSDTDVPSDFTEAGGNRTTQRTGTDTTTYNLTEQDTGTDTHADSGRDTTDREYKLTFKGRVGNFSPSDMLEKEVQFRRIDFFNNIVYPDVDKILTLSIY